MPTSCLPIVCSTTCADVLPPVSFSLCAPEVNFGEIDEILVSQIGNPLVDENLLSEWTTRFAAVDNTKIVRLFVTGDKPVPTGNEVVIAKKIVVYGEKDHVINFDIQDTNHINYEFMRGTECGAKRLIWYKTAGGKLYGGAKGIEATINLAHNIPRSNKDVTTFTGTVKWSSKFSPCETISVI